MADTKGTSAIFVNHDDVLSSSSKGMIYCRPRPYGTPTMKKPPATDVLSSRLNELSTEERSKALHELHGVADQVPEEPEMIKSKVQEMTVALNDFSIGLLKAGNDTMAYVKAQRMAPAYVEGLKVRFLRSTRYNSQNAAGRMIHFFKQKLTFFGEDKLVQDLTFQDLNGETQEMLRNGLIQMLPQRDRSGRSILFVHGQVNGRCLSTENVVRALMYFTMATLQDEESQRNGTVVIYYGVGQDKTVLGRSMEYIKWLESLPMYVVAGHYCKDSSILDPTIRLIHRGLESKLLCRVRFHIGTHVECTYNLMTFGISKEAIPIGSDGCADLTNHHNMLRSIQSREDQAVQQVLSAPPDNEKIETNLELLVPGPLDIVMGRGRYKQTCKGALLLHNLVQEHSEAYDAAQRIDKSVITGFLLNEVKKSGCRFLTASEGGFTECSDTLACEKIAHIFRNLRSKSKRGGGSTSSTTKAKKRSLVDT